MSRPKSHQVQLVVGDWSGDGHNRTDSVSVLVNCSTEQLQEAYKKGSKKLKFDLTKEAAVEYEDNKLPMPWLSSAMRISWRLV